MATQPESTHDSAPKSNTEDYTMARSAAFASTGWLAAHMLAMVAFTLVPLGLLGLHLSIQETAGERSWLASQQTSVRARAW